MRNSMGDARKFTEEHPRFWIDMVDEASWCYQRGLKFRPKAFVEEYRSRISVDKKPYAIDNNFTRYFADMLVEQYPELAETVVRRGHAGR